jgi:hypothetical protein
MFPPPQGIEPVESPLGDSHRILKGRSHSRLFVRDGTFADAVSIHTQHPVRNPTAQDGLQSVVTS